ncbi:MAG: amidohydrolase, partial [Chloroflexota bacterium]
HPIYTAAERHGLPVAIHPGTEGRGITTPCTSAGYPSRYVEWHTNLALNYMAHLVSMVAEGVFVKFPRLRMVFLEGGAAWAPPILWRLDKNYKALRSECPWLADLPSVYVKQHFRFGTHGLERPDDPARLWSFLRAMGAERLLMYGSNYPCRDLETLQESVALLTAEASVRRRIVFENAQELYRVPV